MQAVAGAKRFKTQHPSGAPDTSLMNDVLKTSANVAGRANSIDSTLNQMEEKVNSSDSFNGHLSSVDRQVQVIKMNLAEEVKNYFRDQPA